MATLTASGTDLPEPVEISSGDEIIWSSNTGRSSETGTMVGDVVAQKKTVDIKWGILTESELATINSALAAGFFTLTIRDYGTPISITVYRGTLTKDHLGYIGDGTYYYKSASVSLIQK